MSSIIRKNLADYYPRSTGNVGGSQQFLICFAYQQSAVIHSQRFKNISLHVGLKTSARHFRNYIAKNLKRHVAVLELLARSGNQRQLAQTTHISFQRAIVIFGFVPLIVLDIGHT